MKTAKIKITAIMASAAALAILSVSCGSGKPANAVVSFFTGTAMIKKGTAGFRPVQIKDMVEDGDVIETGSKSSVIVQVGDELTVRFEENTSVVVKSIKDMTKREIQLDKGKVLSKVSKLKRGSEYNIKTPTAVASVRGTEFLTESDSRGTVVAVGKGRVSVVKTASAEEKFADPGKSVVVTDSMETRDINRVETLELKKLEGTPVIDDIEKLPVEEIKKKFEETEKSEAEINAEIDKLSGMSLEEIRVKYKRVDVIIMYNGRTIRGAILQRGKYMKILTPGGVVTVNSKDVRRTGIM